MRKKEKAHLGRKLGLLCPEWKERGRKEQFLYNKWNSISLSASWSSSFSLHHQIQKWSVKGESPIPYYYDHHHDNIEKFSGGKIKMKCVGEGERGYGKWNRVGRWDRRADGIFINMLSSTERKCIRRRKHPNFKFPKPASSLHSNGC